MKKVLNSPIFWGVPVFNVPKSNCSKGLSVHVKLKPLSFFPRNPVSSEKNKYQTTPNARIDPIIIYRFLFILYYMFYAIGTTSGSYP